MYIHLLPNMKLRIIIFQFFWLQNGRNHFELIFSSKPYDTYSYVSNDNDNSDNHEDNNHHNNNDNNDNNDDNGDDDIHNDKND